MRAQAITSRTTSRGPRDRFDYYNLALSRRAKWVMAHQEVVSFRRETFFSYGTISRLISHIITQHRAMKPFNHLLGHFSAIKAFIFDLRNKNWNLNFNHSVNCIF